MYPWSPFSVNCRPNAGKYSCGVDMSLPSSAVTDRIMHAQYFALMNFYLKYKLPTRASFSLLLNLLGD